MIKNWQVFSETIDADIHNYSDLTSRMTITNDAILRGLSKGVDGKNIFIVKPLSKEPDYEKLKQIFSESEGDDYKEDFYIQDIVEDFEKYQVYLDRSLMYRSDYYIVDWENRKIYKGSLAEILKQFNFVAWIDIVK